MLHIFKGNISYNKFVHRLRSKPWTNKSKNLGGFLLFFTSYPNSNLNIIEYSRTSKVACICTLSAFYHMARKHSKGVSTQATNETTVQPSVQYMCTHSCPQAPRPVSPKNNTDPLTNQEQCRNIGMSVNTAVVVMTSYKH